MTPLEIIAIISGGLRTIKEIAEWIGKMRDGLKQSGELTPAQEAELDKLIADTLAQDHWKPDGP